MRILDQILGTPGKRLHAAIIVLAAVYGAGHIAFGLWLIEHQTPAVGLLLAITVAAAFGNLFAAVPLWVLSAVALWRGPRPLVVKPEPVADDDLPEIIVQVPGRNEPIEMVRRSIDSVLHASYPASKLTVQFIDNSDDDRWQRVKDCYAAEPRVRVEHRDGTKGFKGGNLNFGLQRLGLVDAPSRVLIGLLDVGDTFAPETLRPMATEFVRDERLGFVQGMFRTGNPDDTVINWTESHVGDAARRFTEGYIAHYGLPTMNGHCALLRLKALQEVGGWNEARVAEDWSSGITMLARGWTGKWVDYEPNNPAMVSTELVPGEIHAQQKQKRRWATGATELTKLHLAEWLRADMPWNQRLSLLLRLGANFSVLPGFIVQLLLPMWLSLALLGGEPTEVMWLGVISALLQNPFLAVNLAAATNYAREGRWRRAGLLLLAYPVDALWRLPLFAHAGLGIAEGLSRGLKEFVVTPKVSAHESVWSMLRAQRLVLLVSLVSLLPLVAVVLAHPERGSLALAGALLPLLTITALFLVPGTQWVRRRFQGRRRSATD